MLKAFVQRVVVVRRTLLDLLTILSELKGTPRVIVTNKILDWVFNDITGKSAKSAVEATKDMAQSPQPTPRAKRTEKKLGWVKKARSELRNVLMGKSHQKGTAKERFSKSPKQTAQ